MAGRDSNHKCHAYACNSNVPPRMLMCAKHWRIVPKATQNRVWATYQPGQERRMDPSHAYLNAAAEAVRLVAAWEGHDDETVKADPAYAGYMAWIGMTDECGDVSCSCTKAAI